MSIVSVVKKAFEDYENNLKPSKSPDPHKDARRYILMSRCAEYFLDELSKYTGKEIPCDAG